VRIAIVQPITHRPPEDELNVDDAIDHINSAASEGADLIVFPESYPGPWRMPMSFDPTPAIVDAAARHRVYVQFGTLEPIDVVARTAYNVLALAGPSGDEPGVYRRTHPPGPWIYSGGDEWDFEYVAGSALPVFPTPDAVIGLAICSEVYVPEVSRALALQGAELILLPAGTDKRNLWRTWHQLIWARAIENLAYVVTTQNLFAATESGLAMVAGPEAILFEALGPGRFMVDVDLGRIRQLRVRTDGARSDACVKTGLLDQWYRPEVFRPG
jgi:predicted amidohydrolase